METSTKCRHLYVVKGILIRHYSETGKCVLHFTSQALRSEYSSGNSFILESINQKY